MFLQKKKSFVFNLCCLQLASTSSTTWYAQPIPQILMRPLHVLIYKIPLYLLTFSKSIVSKLHITVSHMQQTCIVGLKIYAWAIIF